MERNDSEKIGPVDWALLVALAVLFWIGIGL